MIELNGEQCCCYCCFFLLILIIIIGTRVSVPVDERCEVVMGGERMEAVKEFKYLGTVLRNHGEMEGEAREKTVKGRSVIGSLVGVMRGRNGCMEVKRGLRNSILLPP